MRKLAFVVATLSATAVLPGAALAADPVQDYAHDWSGFYIGAHVGYGGANVSGVFDSEDFDPGDTFAADGAGPFDLDLDGFLGGGQIGYNLQSGSIVFGLEGDISFVDWSDKVSFDPDNEAVSAETDFVGTLRGRLGFAMDNLLLFGTAGAALTDTKYTADNNGDKGSLDFNDIGLVVGGGAEYAINESWSIKAEALYFVFDDKRDGSTLTNDSEVGDFAKLEDAWMARVGVNFHF
jgi:outer membrane immunogenic protein